MALIRTVYRLLQKSACEFARDSIPLTGVINSDLRLTQAGPQTAIRQYFLQTDTVRPATGSGDSINVALDLLEQLQSQLTILQNTDADTRQALSSWQSLILQQHRVPGQYNWRAAAQAIESGSQTLFSLTQPLSSTFLFDDEADEQAKRVATQNEETSAALDRLADEVLQDLAGDPKARLESLAEVVNRKHRIRFEPFEWVYDGLKPLLLPDILETKKGMSHSLAALYCCVARRAGLQLIPIPIKTTGGIKQASPAALLHASPAVAPEPLPWLLQLHVDGSDEAQPLYLDPVKAAVLDQDAARQQHPTLEQEEQTPFAAVLTFWAESARMAMIAHQRRGEGDAVALWMYQLMALDTQAEEWDAALSSSKSLQ
ncbi:hypothetical protein WJX74_003759 [Apatococcus lobatus]|uniref:Protein SirB1 N-terminal domain-containing protein n=2 Tax=Apatococcus TaxID=904362 RepID=A0AAW1SJM5_9CHLO